ncbi:MAG: hypothetical protein IPM45_00815 [Acidimicrobiales bacterium]|nr:hypothetical protein [Acidimicrobiales bacterium]
MKRLALVLLAAALVFAACGGDDDDGGSAGTAAEGTTSTDGGASGGADLSGLTTYATIAEMRDALVADGIACELEYEGLRDAEKEVSICTIEGEFAQLTVWLDPSIVEDLVGASDGTLAVGANWTVDVDTAATAETVAEALGGEAPPVAG